ncbi:hypothetical protein JQ615_28625 [Bradyrhizobium jicamae]|uniref:Cysteine rich repeat-containing protein n=1 Tax=Bradyrhizobium jicamae TaxID=280332 RepID=A0ABS5FRE1_9BRAD|nr:hypothetical protein [Bradyrhizobium jicamae]MBR0799358.1 hypothetical protein [Bradyrhizobium jicamae]MBR0939190.1 hypothetical protein [Bradyrhizobium jicamae]
MRYFLLVTLGVAAALTANGSALAQHRGTQSEQSACTRDAQRFCRKDLGNDDAVQSCLQMKRASLSRSCKKVFESHGM